MRKYRTDYDKILMRFLNLFFFFFGGGCEFKNCTENLKGGLF